MADIQVNLLPKDARDLQSHEIAKQVRQRLVPIAERYGARIKVAEVPPGPPVLETLVAEVYGPSMERRIALARQIRDLFKQTKGVVDVDWYVEDDQTKYRLLVDEEKAALNGISEDDIARAMQMASGRLSSGTAASGRGEGRRRADRAAGSRDSIRSGAYPGPEDRRAQRAARSRWANWCTPKKWSRTRASITRTCCR